jgi:hypothetical protein
MQPQCSLIRKAVAGCPWFMTEIGHNLVIIVSYLEHPFYVFEAKTGVGTKQQFSFKKDKNQLYLETSKPVVEGSNPSRRTNLQTSLTTSYSFRIIFMTDTLPNVMSPTFGKIISRRFQIIQEAMRIVSSI